jgi:hypothetical protein
LKRFKIGLIDLKSVKDAPPTGKSSKKGLRQPYPEHTNKFVPKVKEAIPTSGGGMGRSRPAP